MSQQLRQLKSRIRSVEGTWKVTRAMEMVSMSKFKSFENPLNMTRQYFNKLEAIAFNLIRGNEESATHPFLKKATGGRVGLLVVSAEAGLCGVYNGNILKVADKFIEENKGRDLKLYIYGRKAASHFKRRRIPIAEVFPGFHGRLKPAFHSATYQFLEKEFLTGEVSEIYVAHTVFQNAMKHHPMIKKLLGIEVPPGEGSNFIIETGQKGIMSDVVPMYASNRLRLMLLESFTSEHSARMVAMKAAKDNAKELMGDLVLLRNKIRQAVITKEIIEIISSAEALKG
jgi:F-type H+-transporting ATPase subunit gamma